MNSFPRFRYYLALLLFLLLSLAVRAQATTAPPTGSPVQAQQALQMAEYLTQALSLSAQQVAQVQAPVLHRVQDLGLLQARTFRSAPAASAAYTVVEYHYFTAMTDILTPKQFDQLVLIDAPLLTTKTTRLTVR